MPYSCQYSSCQTPKAAYGLAPESGSRPKLFFREVGAPAHPIGFYFPQGVSYGWSGTNNVTITMKANGSATISPSTQNAIPLKNLQGVRDTFVVLTSGLVMSQ